MTKINCIIVEDKQSDAHYLQQIILTHPRLEFKGKFSNPLEARPFIAQHQPDLIFMDIDMPIMSGMDFFRQLDPQPICIFVTAFSEHAWQSYEAQAFDFILKPVMPQRFAACIRRLEEYVELLKRSDIYESQVEKQTIILKEGYTNHVIPLGDIEYIEALKDYSKIVTAHKKVMTLSKLKHLMERLPKDEFLRIHRSYAVAKGKIKSFRANTIVLENISLPVGKTFREEVKSMI